MSPTTGVFQHRVEKKKEAGLASIMSFRRYRQLAYSSWAPDQRATGRTGRGPFLSAAWTPGQARISTAELMAGGPGIQPG